MTEGIGAAVEYIEAQIEAGAFDGGVARCRATTRKGKPCQRTPLPEREYCPSHQHLEARPQPRSYSRQNRRGRVLRMTRVCIAGDHRLDRQRDCPRRSRRPKT